MRHADYNFFTDFLFAYASAFSINHWYGLDLSKPFYFAVEGIDGVGKSTFTNYLEDALKHSPVKYIRVREPFEPDKLPQHPTALDFCNDRFNYYTNHRPDPDTWILSDRSLLSTLAYNRCSNSLIRSMVRWWDSPRGLGDYNKVLFYLETKERIILRRLKQRGEILPIEADRRYQRQVSYNYTQLIHEETIPFDIVVRVNSGYRYPLTKNPPIARTNYYGNK